MSLWRFHLTPVCPDGRGRAIVAIALTVVLLCPPAARAQDPGAPPAGLPATPVVARPDEPGVALSLGDTLRTALENNLDLVIRRRDPLIAEQNVTLAEAPFDPELFFQGDAASSQSEFRDPPTTLSATAGYRDLLRVGGGYSVEIGVTRTEAEGLQFDPITGVFREFGEAEYGTAYSVNFDLPLLGGRGREVNELDILLARENVDVSRQELTVRAQTLLQDVESAYWDVVGAREALEVALQSMRLAEDLLILNRKKVEVGTLAPIDITEAEAGVASRQETVILAETSLRDAEDRLRLLMGVERTAPLWGQPLQPTVEPTFEPVQVNLEQAIEQALANRPELAQARSALRSAELTERVATRNLRNDLDLTGRLVSRGNNVTYTPAVVNGEPTFIPEYSGFGSSFSDAAEFENYDWNVALTYTIPLRNRSDRARSAIAALEREQAEVGIDNIEQTIRVEVRIAVRAVESGGERVAAARANVRLQQKRLEAEQKKFDNGMSTSFQVLEAQTDLADAQFAEVRALIDYNKALAALERARGTILEARGMRFEPVVTR